MLINASQMRGIFFYRKNKIFTHFFILFVDNLSKFFVQKNLNLNFIEFPTLSNNNTTSENI